MFNIETETRLIMEIVEREPFEATFGIAHSKADYEALNSAIEAGDSDAYKFDEGIYFYIMAFDGETIRSAERNQDLWTFAPKDAVAPTESKKFIIDFEAWTTIEATDVEDAFAQAQGIINACVYELEQAGVKLEMVVRDSGITESEEE